MTLTEILPAVRSLSRSDKQRLAGLLSRELAERVSEAVAPPAEDYLVLSPYDEFEAAKALMRLLDSTGERQ